MTQRNALGSQFRFFQQPAPFVDWPVDEPTEQVRRSFSRVRACVQSGHDLQNASCPSRIRGSQPAAGNLSKAKALLEKYLSGTVHRTEASQGADNLSAYAVELLREINDTMSK